MRPYFYSPPFTPTPPEVDSYQELCISMSILSLKDAVLELFGQDDCYLIGVDNLLLEASLNGKAIGKVDLVSHKTRPGVWETDQSLNLTKLATDFMVCVYTEVNDKERQLLGFMELNGPELQDTLGREVEIPLICDETHFGLVLKIRAVLLETAQGSPPEVNLPQTKSYEEIDIEEIFNDATNAFEVFENHGNLDSLQRAISLLQFASEVASEEEYRFIYLISILAEALSRRYDILHDFVDLDDAIKLEEKVVGLVLDDDPHKPDLQFMVARELMKRFKLRDNVIDIENAIMHLQAAIGLLEEDHPKKPTYLSGLGSCFHCRYERFGNPSDTENAIVWQQEAVDSMPDNYSDKPGLLYNLGVSFTSRFKDTWNISDLETAISHLHLAVNLTPDGHHEKPSYLCRLSASLLQRFQYQGNLADIDDAIIYQQAAVDLSPKGFNKRFFSQFLGTILSIRFRRLGNLVDVEDAISRQQEAINFLPVGHPDLPIYVQGLGISLTARFEKSGNIDDLDATITLLQSVVDSIPDEHPVKLLCLVQLGIALHNRFEKLGDLADMDNSIARRRAAVEIASGGHAFRAGALHNLGAAFVARFKQSEDPKDLDNGIKQLQQALDFIPTGHPDSCGCLLALGQALWSRAKLVRHPEDVEAAISYLSASVISKVGPPSLRFEAAEQWISIAATIDHPSLLNAYECAINIMPVVAWLGLSIVGRHESLVKIGGTARNAAAAAISLEQYDKALEWLEQGRSIVWTQVLHLRTPLDRLRDANPTLADRLLHVSQQLEENGGQNQLPTVDRKAREEGQRHRRLTTEWENLIDQVRSIPQFESFLRPPKLSQLIGAAHNGPVVVVNISESGCDALAIITGFEDVIHIPLPDLTFEKVTQLQDDLKGLLSSSGIRIRAPRAANRLNDDDDDESCKWILAELWKCLVKPILDTLAFSPHPEVLPRIWWCATGPLAFLPIHAAGIYEKDAVDSKIYDYVISSYTPTLSNLLEAPDHPIAGPFRLLSVIEASAPGVSYIPNTEEELRRIRKHFMGPEHLVLEGPEATKKRVIKEMEDCNWIHLACHGAQNPLEPTKSALILRDGRLALEEIIKLKLPKAEFAFLSACQTTAGDEKLSEEAVHIAGGMLLAGYRSVVATMWSIQDELAPEVADEFYAQMRRDEERPSNKRAAEALHYSVKKLRQKNIPLTAWIPFVHLGI